MLLVALEKDYRLSQEEGTFALYMLFIAKGLVEWFKLTNVEIEPFDDHGVEFRHRFYSDAVPTQLKLRRNLLNAIY